jgi:hypothetical protein
MEKVSNNRWLWVGEKGWGDMMGEKMGRLRRTISKWPGIETGGVLSIPAMTGSLTCCNHSLILNRTLRIIHNNRPFCLPCDYISLSGKKVTS